MNSAFSSVSLLVFRGDIGVPIRNKTGRNKRNDNVPRCNSFHPGNLLRKYIIRLNAASRRFLWKILSNIMTK